MLFAPIQTRTKLEYFHNSVFRPKMEQRNAANQQIPSLLNIPTYKKSKL